MIISEKIGRYKNYRVTNVIFFESIMYVFNNEWINYDIKNVIIPLLYRYLPVISCFLFF